MHWTLVPDWRNRHKFASTWVAGFWGVVGAALSLAPFLVTMNNIWWLGPLVLAIAATHGIALFTHQPGVE